MIGNVCNLGCIVAYPTLNRSVPNDFQLPFFKSLNNLPTSPLIKLDIKPPKPDIIPNTVNMPGPSILLNQLLPLSSLFLSSFLSLSSGIKKPDNSLTAFLPKLVTITSFGSSTTSFGLLFSS